MNNELHTTLWDQYERSAAIARKQGNFNKAARLLKEAFRECEEYAEIAPGLVAESQRLAELFMSQHRYAEAEALFRSVLELREKLLGQTHADVIESLKSVAIVQICAFRVEALGRQVVSPPSSWPSIIAAAC